MLTINIEDNSLKITSVRGKSVAFAIESPLEAGWVQNGVVNEKARVGQIIGMLLAENRIKEKECIACVSGIHSIYRVAYVPRLDPALLAEKVKEEMEKAIPVPLDSLYTYWTDIRMSDVETALCLVGLPFDNVNSVIETLKSGGLQPKYLELKPLAVSRVIDEKTAIVLNVQPAAFDITIVNDGLPELIRSLPFPALTMSEGDKAAMVKEEVERTVSFYNSGHPNSPLNNQTYCILSGSLREKLSTMLVCPSKPPPGLLFYPQGQDESTFTANTGLALRTINRLTRVDINAIPQAAAAHKQAGRRPGFNMLPVVTLVVCAAAALGMWAINAAAEGETVKLQLQMNEKTRLWSDTQKLYREGNEKAEKELAAYKLIVDTYSSPIKYVAESRGLVNRDIGEVIAPLPGSMYLTSIAVSSGNIVIKGSAPSEEILLNYARDLRAKGIFKLVMITSVDKSSFIEVTFKMTLTTMN
jgi:type IV pilus assembly protein PilM